MRNFLRLKFAVRAKEKNDWRRSSLPVIVAAIVGLFVLSWLIGRSGQFPRGLNYWGYLLAILFIILYLGRLILFSPTNPLVFVPVLLSGFLVNPVWYLWLGFALWLSRRRT